MKHAILFFVAAVLLSSCFLRRDYRASRFNFEREGQTVSIPLIVPKGFQRQERVDTAGISLQTFYYPNGAILYSAYLKDSAMQLQSINEKVHQPRVHFLGGQVYKGVDGNELFYREIRQGNLRFGYRLVPPSVELQFDSATNYASLQKNNLQ